MFWKIFPTIVCLLPGQFLSSPTPLLCHTCAHMTVQNNVTRIKLERANSLITDKSCLLTSKWKGLPHQSCTTADEVCAAIHVWDNIQNSVMIRACLPFTIPDLINSCAYFKGKEHENFTLSYFETLFNGSNAIAINLCTCNWNNCNPRFANAKYVEYGEATDKTTDLLRGIYKVANRGSIKDKDSASKLPSLVTNISNDILQNTTEQDIEEPTHSPTIFSNVSISEDSTSRIDTWRNATRNKNASRSLESTYVKIPPVNLLRENLSDVATETSVTNYLITTAIAFAILSLLVIIAIIVWHQAKPRRYIQQELANLSHVYKSEMKERDKYEINDFQILSTDTDVEESRHFTLPEYTRTCFGKIIQNQDIIQVAVKMPKKRFYSHSTVTGIRILIQESKILSCIGKHKHIVHFYGASTKDIKSGLVYVFIKLYSLGSLKSALIDLRQNMRTDSLNNSVMRNLHRWSYEISQGMEFIASKKVVHADLCATNIYLDSQKTAKIANFGYARFYNEPNILQKSTNWPWMAPESLKRGEFTEKTDVWSYGITIWEIYTLGDNPFPGLAWPSNFGTQLKRGLRLSKPRFIPDKIHLLMLRCWNANPDKRPSFAKIRHRLHAFSTKACKNNTTHL